MARKRRKLPGYPKMVGVHGKGRRETGKYKEKLMGGKTEGFARRIALERRKKG